MQALRRIAIMLILSVVAGVVCLSQAPPTTVGSLAHRYSIYYSSDDGEELNLKYGSRLYFTLNGRVEPPTYEYYVRMDKHVAGRIIDYKITEEGREYLLENFFEGKHNATMRIIDLPNCDNLKACMTVYANEKEDTTGTCLQLILLDDEIILQ